MEITIVFTTCFMFQHFPRQAKMANDDPWGNDTAAADPWGSGGGATEDGDTDVNSNTKGAGDNACFVCKEEVRITNS